MSIHNHKSVEEKALARNPLEAVGFRPLLVVSTIRGRVVPGSSRVFLGGEKD